ncbi:hypothetical protein Tco_0265201 [Tanacetum coccineum]
MTAEQAPFNLLHDVFTSFLLLEGEMESMIFLLGPLKQLTEAFTGSEIEFIEDNRDKPEVGIIQCILVDLLCHVQEKLLVLLNEVNRPCYKLNLSARVSISAQLWASSNYAVGASKQLKP